MKKLLYTLCFICSMCITSNADEYIVESLPDAIILAESSDRHIMVIFGSKDCVFCERLKTDVFNGEFSEHTSNMIICYVDIEKDTEYRKEYRVRTIPDTRMIYNKEEKHRIVGYSKKKFDTWLNNYNESSQ